MAFKYFGTGSGSGSVINVEVNYPVKSKGILVGGPDGAHGISLIATGAQRIVSPTGLDGSPVFYTLPGITRVAKTQGMSSSTESQFIEVVPELEELQITEISVSKIALVSPTGVEATDNATLLSALVDFRMSIYAAPPVAGVWQPDALIAPSQPLTDGGGRRVILLTGIFREVRRPSVFYLRVNTPSPTALTFDVSILGLPEWQRTWA